MGLIHEEKTYALKIRESADDGSDFSNPEADYRMLFLGEDGQLHVKDSAGSVTDIGGGDVSAHTGDTTDAHDASAISFDPTGLGNTAATEVQTALEDFDAAITAGGGSGELAYQEFTSSASITATTEGTADTVVTAGAITADGSSAYIVEFFSPFTRPQATALASLSLVLYMDGSSIGIIGISQTPSANNANRPVTVRRRIIPSAGSRTFSIRAYISTGTGTVGAGAGGSGANMPGFIRVTRA